MRGTQPLQMPANLVTKCGATFETRRVKHDQCSFSCGTTHIAGDWTHGDGTGRLTTGPLRRNKNELAQYQKPCCTPFLPTCCLFLSARWCRLHGAPLEGVLAGEVTVQAVERVHSGRRHRTIAGRRGVGGPADEEGHPLPPHRPRDRRPGSRRTAADRRLRPVVDDPHTLPSITADGKSSTIIQFQVVIRAWA